MPHLLVLQVAFNSKLWDSLGQHPLRAAFFAPLDSTPWRGWRPPQHQVAEACAEEVRCFLVRMVEQEPEFDAGLCLQQVVQLLQASEDPIATLH